jgi:peptidoglycan/LPS O-acetylase OafA/YrhL
MGCCRPAPALCLPIEILPPVLPDQRPMKRIAELDGVRGVAILLVLIWHYFTCQAAAESRSIFAYCVKATRLTWSGVDLFFVLSGFLIAGILLDNRDSSNYFRVFYLRRMCRIFPLYFLMLALFVLLSATSIGVSPSYRRLFEDPFPLWSYATFTQNLFMGARGDFGANWLNMTWSLAVEEQFYLVVPLLIYFLPRRNLHCVLVVAILAAPVLRSALPGFRAFVYTPWRSDSLLSGVLLALLVRWPPFMSAVRQRRRFVSSLFLVLLAGAAVMTRHEHEFGAFNHLWLAGLYSVFVLIAFAGAEPRIDSLLRSSVLVWFGKLSYGIYMFHQAVSGLLHGALRHSEPTIRTLSDAAITVMAFFITMLLAAFSYYFFERPILRFGHRHQYSPCRRSSQPMPSEA